MDSPSLTDADQTSVETNMFGDSNSNGSGDPGAGTTKHNKMGKTSKSDKSTSVPLSEEFQARTLDHLKGASKDELNFVNDQVNKRRDEIYKSESSKEPSIADYDNVKSSD